MMTIDLSNLTPAPRPPASRKASRPAPCAGLFGWRKDDAASKPEPKDNGRD